MYQDPLIQAKSDECAKIWHRWYDARFEKKDDELASQLRKEWGACCDECSELLHLDYLTNPRYKHLRNTI